MNNRALILSIAAACGAAASAPALAAEYGRVLTRTAIYERVAVPEQECFSQPMAMQQPPTGGGAALGAVAGGVLGNTIGHGAGRAAATAIGAVTGAVVGNNVEAATTPPVVVNGQQCQTVTRYDNRLIGYDVVYEYRGQRYTTRVPRDPGSRIAVNVDVSAVDEMPPPGAMPPPPPDGGPVTYGGTATVEGAYAPAPVYAAPAYPAYPAYYAAPAYVAPVSVGIGLGFWGGGHRHWR